MINRDLRLLTGLNLVIGLNCGVVCSAGQGQKEQGTRLRTTADRFLAL